MKITKGLKINYLTVLDDNFVTLEDGKKYNLCECECENIKYIKHDSIRTRRVRDCGCGSYMLKRLMGQKFGRLTPISAYRKRLGKNNRVNIIYICKCDCGNIVDVNASKLILGKKTSCGCLYKEIIAKRRTERVPKPRKTYKNDRLRRIFHSMKSRCYDSNSKDYKWYGAKGVKIYDQWLVNFHTFFDWAWDNGYNDILTIDRIDPTGDYCPENCRWVTMEEQQNNRRNNVKYDFNGNLMTLSQIAKKININCNTLRSRLRSGMSFEECVTTPLMRRR